MNLCIINFSHRDYKKCIYLPVAYIGHWNVLTSVMLHGFKIDCSCICVCFCSCFCLNCICIWINCICICITCICICITCICIWICICCGENEHPDAPGWVELHRLRFGHSAPLPLEARPLSLAGTPARGGRGGISVIAPVVLLGRGGPRGPSYRDIWGSVKKTEGVYKNKVELCVDQGSHPELLVLFYCPEICEQKSDWPLKYWIVSGISDRIISGISDRIWDWILDRNSVTLLGLFADWWPFKLSYIKTCFW